LGVGFAGGFFRVIAKQTLMIVVSIRNPFMQALDLASIRMFHGQPVDVFVAETMRGE
jgi:hypothetical protein